MPSNKSNRASPIASSARFFVYGKIDEPGVFKNNRAKPDGFQCWLNELGVQFLSLRIPAKGVVYPLG